MVSLVTQMLESKNKQHEATIESQKTYYEDKCNSLDRQIDDLVYELYGITDEERKIIKEK